MNVKSAFKNSQTNSKIHQRNSQFWCSILEELKVKITWLFWWWLGWIYWWHEKYLWILFQPRIKNVFMIIKEAKRCGTIHCWSKIYCSSSSSESSIMDSEDSMWFAHRGERNNIDLSGQSSSHNNFSQSSVSWKNQTF